jgi:hypothetical protein
MAIASSPYLRFHGETEAVIALEGTSWMLDRYTK